MCPTDGSCTRVIVSCFASGDLDAESFNQLCIRPAKHYTETVPLSPSVILCASSPATLQPLPSLVVSSYLNVGIPLLLGFLTLCCWSFQMPLLTASHCPGQGDHPGYTKEGGHTSKRAGVNSPLLLGQGGGDTFVQNLISAGYFIPLSFNSFKQLFHGEGAFFFFLTVQRETQAQRGRVTWLRPSVVGTRTLPLGCFILPTLWSFA